jgi:hypothetical protein
MLNQKIEMTLSKLDQLIDFTNEEIKIVKEAKHDLLSQKVEEKNRLLREFESAKQELNMALMSVSENSSSLEESIGKKERGMLELFREKLTELKRLNGDLAAIVIVLNEFYTTLFGKMFSFDTKGYQYSKPNPAAVLKVSA